SKSEDHKQIPLQKKNQVSKKRKSVVRKSTSIGKKKKKKKKKGKQIKKVQKEKPPPELPMPHPFELSDKQQAALKELAKLR
ncbi:MAG: hypothetical protein EZS28_051127, partial [Streblomastix strix]